MTSLVEFAVPSATVASFSMCRILLCATATEASSVSGVAPVPVTVAVLTMAVPASSSACVTVMAGRVLPGLADIQQIVLVGVAGIEARRSEPAPRWS